MTTDSTANQPVESNRSHATVRVASAASDAYRPGDNSIAGLTTRSFDNKKMTDHEMSRAINDAMDSLYPVPSRDHGKGLHDIHAGLNNVDNAADRLTAAIKYAKRGDSDGALQALRETSDNLNAGGKRIDNGHSNTSDLTFGDKDAQKSQSKMFDENRQTGNYIQEAAQRLRSGDVDGAIRSMGRGSEHLSEEQKAIHHNLSQLTNDNDKFDHNRGLKDLRSAITTGDTVSSNLDQATAAAKHGDSSRAIQLLHDTEDSMNSASGKIDKANSNLSDLISNDSSARHHMRDATSSERDAYKHVDEALEKLRNGDLDGAIKAMDQGSQNIDDQQKELRTSIHKLQNDYAPGLGDRGTVHPIVLDDGTTGWVGENRKAPGDNSWDFYQPSKIDLSRTPDEHVRDAKKITRLIN